MMYAMVLTRPDLAYALSVVSRFMSLPEKEHQNAVKWVLRYLNGTLEYGSVYRRSCRRNTGLWDFIDSNFVGDLDRKRFLTRYIFMLNGCLINQKASLQHIVALSTAEVEYITITEAVKEVLWLQGLLAKLGLSQKTIDIYCNSSNAIYLSKNLAYYRY